MKRRDFLQATAMAAACSPSMTGMRMAMGADGKTESEGSGASPPGTIAGRDGCVVFADVAFHGVAELQPVNGLPGLRLQRVPESVRKSLNDQAARRMLGPEGVEMRFVSQSPDVEVTLSSPTGGADLVVFWGGFQDIEQHTIGAAPTTLKLAYPERLAQLKLEYLGNYPFSPVVWRLTFRGKRKDATLHFHNIRGDGLRPPHPRELPAHTCLAYGTSVTDGFGATAMHLTFIAQVARRLRADYVNLGSAGSAYCEPELADYMAARRDWQIATLCISLNMVGHGFSVDEFRRRATYMVNRMAESDPKRLVVCISCLPYFGDICRDVEGPHGKGLAPEYRRALQQIVRDAGHANLHFVEGSELIPDLDGFTMDLAHPGDFGMIQIGERLADRIRPLLTNVPTRDL